MQIDIEAVRKIQRQRAKLIESGELTKPTPLSQNPEQQKMIEQMEKAQSRKRGRVVFL
ncbi:hypothetical protein SC171_05495 [Pantoea cypripedii]|uniref:hypothetical protein n=1 Tax=Pantoea cypripedii TaxID=55209 RepID=UPI002FC8718E